MLTAATRHAEEVRGILKLEREQMVTERAEFTNERERVMGELRLERVRLDAAKDSRISELQAELEKMRVELGEAKAELGVERALGLSEEPDKSGREKLGHRKGRNRLFCGLF
jgi:hypothetical protein